MSTQDWKRWLAEAIESTTGWWALFARGDQIRDKFPLPSYAERLKWFQLWNDDRRAWETSLNEILPRGWVRRRKPPGQMITMCLDRLAAFASNGNEAFWDQYFGSLKIRFILRVFLPCMVLHRSRPMTLLSRCVEENDIGLLESLLRIDQTLLYCPALAPMLHPPRSATQAEVWQVLCPSLASDAPLIDKRQVSYHLIAFIRWVAAAVHRKATIPSLIAALPDGDLPEIEGTTQKAVRRILADAPHPQ